MELKEIKEQIQYLEDIIDNLKADLQIVFDESADMKMRKMARGASITLLDDDIGSPIVQLRNLVRSIILKEE